MANRDFNRRQSLEREVKDLYVKVAIGAAGAPSLVSGASYGAASVSRNSAGDYTLVLQDRYVALKHMEATLQSSTAEDIMVQLKSEAINSAAKSISFFTLAGATPTDPSNGAQLLIKLELKNTSAV
jgi:hypothetical protein